MDFEFVIWPHAKFVGRLGTRRDGSKEIIRINLARIKTKELLKEVLVTHIHELVHWGSGHTNSHRTHNSWDRILENLVQ